MPRSSAAPRKAAPRRRAPARKSAPPRSAPRSAMVRQPALSSAANAFRSAGTGVGGAIGTALGGPAGGAVGGLLGRGAGALLSKIMGHGDYVVSAGVQSNSIMDPKYEPQALSFNSGKTVVRIKHREFLGDVVSSSTANTFSIKSYSIQPGLSQVFPWLSQVCNSTFQQYRLNGMVFEFRSMSADALNSTNTALGSVIMATDYDSADAAFTSKQQMENSEFGVSCKPSSCMLHAIECQRSMTSISEQYIRAYANPPGTDIRLYDLGKFYIATNGFQGTNVNCGELWVSYDVTLIKAISQGPGYSIPVSTYTITSGGAISLNAKPFGSAGGDVGRNVVVDQIGLTVTGTTIKFPYDMPKGILFNVSYQVIGAATAMTLGALTGSNGLDCATQYKISDCTSTNAVWTCLAWYNGSGTPSAVPTLNFAGTTLPANVSFAEVSISQVGWNAAGP